MLKNVIRSNYQSLDDTNKTFIQSNIISGLQDTTPQLRNLTGNVITELVRRGGLHAWPQALPQLVEIIEDKSGRFSSSTQDGAMNALNKICEDNKKMLDTEYQGQRPLDVLIPRMLDLTTDKSIKIRSNALSIIDKFVTNPPPQAIQKHVQSIMQHLFQCAGDEDEVVRTFVCQLFSSLTPIFPALIVPHLPQIIEYIITQMEKDPNADLAAQAADYITKNCEVESLRAAFFALLPRIVPVLLDCMIYGETDQLRISDELEQDAAQDERAQDAKPQFANAKLVTAGKNIETQDDDDSDDDLSEGEIDEGYGSDPEGEWNLRKRSAAALDSFAERYQKPVFDIVLPFLQENLVHTDWQNREVGVLVLGAISIGCTEEVTPHLPQLVEYLIKLLDDPVHAVRTIACWTLSRYMEWNITDPVGNERFYERTMDGLLKHMLDRHKNVQVAAASAFASLEEHPQANLTPYAKIIVEQFAACFALYKDSTMYHLYDCIQRLCEHIGHDMTNPDLSAPLMKALSTKESNTQDAAQGLLPLFECLQSVASAMGHDFAPHAQTLFPRAVRIIKTHVDNAQLPPEQANDALTEDFAIASLDILSAMVQALDADTSKALMRTCERNMFEVMIYAMGDNSREVRQSAYALLGDSTMTFYDQVQPYLDTIMPMVIAQLDLSVPQRLRESDRDVAYRVINNAAWAAGEMAARAGTGMASYLDNLLSGLGKIILDTKVPDAVRETTATAIGMLGFCNDRAVAPHLATLAPYLLATLHNVDWNAKRTAMQGFVMIALVNPAALEQCLVPFLTDMAAGASTGVEPIPEFAQVS